VSQKKHWRSILIKWRKQEEITLHWACPLTDLQLGSFKFQPWRQWDKSLADRFFFEITASAAMGVF
jgi:hypothetical protein